MNNQDKIVLISGGSSHDSRALARAMIRSIKESEVSTFKISERKQNFIQQKMQGKRRVY